MVFVGCRSQFGLRFIARGTIDLLFYKNKSLTVDINQLLTEIYSLTILFHIWIGFAAFWT